LKELRQRTDHRPDQPGDGVPAPALGLARLQIVHHALFQGLGLAAYAGYGFIDRDHGGDAHAHQHGHRAVGDIPADVLGEIEAAAGGHQDRGAVARDVGGCHGALVRALRCLHPVGIDGDVLGR